MRKLLVLLLLYPAFSFAQSKVGIDPTISPALFRYNDQITVVYDLTGTPLAGVDVYAWVWIPGASIDAKYNINPATSAALPAKFTKTEVDGKTLATLVFKPSDFFNQDISAQTKLGILLKAGSWSCGLASCQTTDYIADFWDGTFQVALTSPQQLPLFVNNGEDISIEAETPIAADYKLYKSVNGGVEDLIDQQNDVLTYSYLYTVTETSGYGTFRLEVTEGTGSDEVSFQYLISTSSPTVSRPAGIIPGINYHDGDDTKVTLCLLAPGKSSVYVRGDFSDWDVLGSNLMNRDGEYFWIELSGLTAGVEYAYQYLVDETLWLADPYADKILDPDDQYIPDGVYPDLKSYPSKALLNDWYFNRLAVFETGQPPYEWQVTNFEKPAREELVIYELLIRDFFESDERSYQNLIDTISYFKRLGVNAIELMPVMEFGGNESWGYNPQFMFAPDKAYGPKNKLKEFIDVCHQNGIAVILDITMNHQDIPNPYLLLDFNFSTFKPNPTNKWFNVNATHPFSVFYDMNHESAYTKTYLDTINHYWLNEYKIDGYRFDLSKGFTQVNSGDNVGTWSNYDASRVAILKRMADKIWTHTPEAIVILEHFAANNEEKELAEYRANEGKGMLFWGNLNYAYSQNSMGFDTNSDVSWIYSGSRGWNVPHVIGYMESHDEERMMYRNLQFGRVSATHNVREKDISLKRIRAASTIFYTVPGPKMLWQFGELGYDVSIDEGGRVSPKPVKWEYRDDPARYLLYKHVADLIRLKKEYDIFSSGDATFNGTNQLEKQLMLKNKPYTETPTTTDDMNAVVVVNFDIVAKNIFVDFPHAGVWYDYYNNGSSLFVSTTTFSVTVPAGGYKLFTDVQLSNEIITDVPSELKQSISLYPNPVQRQLRIESDADVLALQLKTIQGAALAVSRLSADTWDVSQLPAGVYVAQVVTTKGTVTVKIIKH